MNQEWKTVRSFRPPSLNIRALRIIFSAILFTCFITPYLQHDYESIDVFDKYSRETLKIERVTGPNNVPQSSCNNGTVPQSSCNNNKGDDQHDDYAKVSKLRKKKVPKHPDILPDEPPPYSDIPPRNDNLEGIYTPYDVPFP